MTINWELNTTKHSFIEFLVEYSCIEFWVSGLSLRKFRQIIPLLSPWRVNIDKINVTLVFSIFGIKFSQKGNFLKLLNKEIQLAFLGILNINLFLFDVFLSMIKNSQWFSIKEPRSMFEILHYYFLNLSFTLKFFCSIFWPVDIQLERSLKIQHFHK